MLDYKTIGKQIKIERIKQSLTQEKVAELSDISIPHLSNIERGSTKVGLTTLVKIANTLHSSIDLLLCYEVDNSVTNMPVNNIVISDLTDCTKQELVVLHDIVIATKRNLRALYNPKNSTD